MAFTANAILTAQGRDLLGKLQAGDTLQLTRAVLGEGIFDFGSGDIEDITSVITPVTEAAAKKISPPYEGSVTVRFDLRAADVPRNFSWTEFGLYAYDEDADAEVLYIYNYTETPDLIQTGGDAKIIMLAVAFGNATDVTITIDESHVYALESDATDMRAAIDGIEGALTVLNQQITTEIPGNAATATKLKNARTIGISGDVTGAPTTFDGSGNITIPVTGIPGNAATATKLRTARTIGISGGATGAPTTFDGSGNITIPVTGVNANNINDGTVDTGRLPVVPVSKGGTGANNEGAARTNLEVLRGVTLPGNTDPPAADYAPYQLTLLQTTTNHAANLPLHYTKHLSFAATHSADRGELILGSRDGGYAGSYYRQGSSSTWNDMGGRFPGGYVRHIDQLNMQQGVIEITTASSTTLREIIFPRAFHGTPNVYLQAMGTPAGAPIAPGAIITQVSSTSSTKFQYVAYTLNAENQVTFQMMWLAVYNI